MQESPITIKPELEERTPRSSKKKKGTPTCADLRRDYFHCGICGSDDLVRVGVIFCKICGNEESFIDDVSSFLVHHPSFTPIKDLCNCTITYGRFTGRPFGDITFLRCAKCGASELRACPVCNSRSCWVSTTGEKYCRGCGFRQASYARNK